MSLPLAGVRVLELAAAAPGPYCGLLLAQLGADVIKVEPPGGESIRGVAAYFAYFNASKRSIALDLKQPGDRAILRALARRSDVVTEGWRPGVAARLGADYASLSAENPGLVYVAISGFGQDGPYQQRAGHDVNYLAIGGLLGLQAQLDGEARLPQVLLSDLASGLFAAMAACAGLAERARTGRGRYVDLSMADTAASWLGLALAREAYGAPETPNTSHLPHYALFTTADGQQVSLGIVREQHFWAALCDRLELPELRDLDGAARQERADELRARLAAVFRTRSAEHWESLLAGVAVPFARVRAPVETLSDPQFARRRLFEPLPSPSGRPHYLPFLPFRLDDRQPGRPAPALDQHRAEILAELGLD